MAPGVAKHELKSATARADLEMKTKSSTTTPKSALMSFADSKGVAWTSREFAYALDADDELSWCRKQFMIPKLNLPDDTNSEIRSIHNGTGTSVYFCGHSLGLQSYAVAENINKVLDNWHTNHIDSHFTGYLPAAHCDESIKDLMANMVGARPNEVAIMNGLTVNLHLMMVSFYKPTPSRHKILLEAKAFPSDHYVVESHIKMRGYNPEESMLEVAFNKDSLWDMDEIIQIIEDQGDSIAVILLPGVQYLTGQVFDMERITKAAHRKGCMVGFDLAHAVGNIQLSLHDWDVDFACWCTYKYVNAGAGGIAGVFLNERIDTSNMDKLSGWWGHKMETRFHMSNKMDLSPGIDGYRLSNPPPLLCAPLHASLEIFNDASMKKLTAKQFKLTGYLELLLKHYFTTDDNTRIDIVTPTSTKERGSMLCLRFARPVDQIFEEVQKYGCIVDKRKPDIMRVTPAPLYCSFEDVYRFVNVLRIVLRDM